MEEIFRACNVDIPNEKGHGLKTVNFSIRKGEILGVFGNRYAGKYKLMGLIAGEVCPSVGIVFFRGERMNYGGGTKGGNPEVICLSRDSMLVGELAIWENLAILWKTKGLTKRVNSGKIKKMITLLLEDYDLAFDVNRKTNTLSQMECLYLEILASRLRRIKVILIDSLDLEGTTREFEKLKSLMEQLKAEGISFVYFSHQMKLLPYLTDRIAFQYDGRIVKIIENGPGYERKANHVIHALYATYKETARRSVKNAESVLTVRNLNVGLKELLNLTLYKGEFTAVVTPYLEVFPIMQQRFFEGNQAETCTIWYDGKQKTVLKESDGILFLNTAYLDQLIEELSPMENLCLGFYEKLSRCGFERKQMIKCVKEDFYRWYGKRGLLEHKDSRHLFKKERIAINLFRLKLVRAKVIICNDFAIHNDLVTYHMVKESLAELLESGTAVCMFTGDVDHEEELVDRYVLLTRESQTRSYGS